jgi:beta-aspartyl-peptidase (threonine type)
MKNSLIALLLVFIALACEKPQNEKTEEKVVIDKSGLPQAVLVIHGGAGTIRRENMDSTTEAAYRQKMEEALRAGYKVLQDGGESCDAIMQTIMVMENSPLFNAGVGAVFTAAEENELDASIMKGDHRNAGAVAGIKTVKNPILAANAVMNNSPHVMLSGRGAETFAEEQGLELVDPSYFRTDRRFEQLMRVKRPKKEYGTVGAIALDQNGNLCAGTSTGGMTNKKWGRIGDSPVIGAGTYADNNTCGVSSTGHGEYFIRGVAAYDVAAKMKYENKNVEQAASEVIAELDAMGGSGGMVAMDGEGYVSMPFSSEGMYRGYITESGEVVIRIFKD